ncbi:MAG TPA: phosphoribosyltransferase family protein [Chloroflexota bacterium]|nr:phosphoribosyltransferase family protein [Chloroflexota bacterium]
MDSQFPNRLEAGRRLASRLQEYRDSPAVVVGLARGGVVVGYGLAAELALPLRALVVRKIGAPSNPELALGAVSETGCLRLDAELARSTGASPDYLRDAVSAEVEEAARRQEAYRVGPGPEDVRARHAILTDDGIATGASAIVGVESLRLLGALSVIVATPVASPNAVSVLRRLADRVVVLDAPQLFYAVGVHYRDFDQVSDAEVIQCLHDAHLRFASDGPATPKS